MVLPRLSARLYVVVALRLEDRDERLVLDSVQVFVETVEKDVEELLRILLVLVVELLLKLGDYALQLERRNRFFTVEPQLLH